MNNSPDNIIEKIRKLMALADKNSGATESEMEVALSMAQALMMKHAIDEDRIRPKDAPGAKERVVGDDGVGFMPWMTNLAAAAATLNMCKSLQQKLHNGHYAFFFVGRPEAAEAAEMLLKQLIKEVDRLYKMNMPKTIPQSQRGKYRDNFKFACSTRINARAWQIMETMKKDDQLAINKTGSTALVVASTVAQRLREAEDWINEKYGDTIKATKRRGRSGQGLAEGLRAGDQAKIREELK